MANNMLVNLSLSHLQRAVALKERIVALETELCEIIGVPSPLAFIQDKLGGKTKTKKTRSPAARAKMAAAQRARWARVKGKSAPTSLAVTASRKPRRKMSPKVRAKLAELAKARWARVRASGKKTLAG